MLLSLVLVHTVNSSTVSTVTSRSHLPSDSSSVQLQKAPSTTLSSVLWVSEVCMLMICITSFCQYIRYVQKVTIIRDKWVCSLMRGVEFPPWIQAGMPSSCSLTSSRRSMAWLITGYTSTPLMPTPSSHSSHLLQHLLQPFAALHNVRHKDNYGHIHRVCGDMSKQSIPWHRSHSKNAQFSDTDVAKVRPICKACVNGELRQTATDQHRVHRPMPTIPGQCFSIDAFACKHVST